MPRVHYVKAARKENPVAKVGEPYYWWKFRYGGKHYSLTPPRPSQLTQSAYLGGVRALAEEAEDWPIEEASDFEGLRDEVCSRLSELRDEAQDSLDNMPENLQEGDTGQMLQERIDNCDNAESEISGMDFDYEPEDGLDEEEKDEDFQTWVSEKRDEIVSLISDCEV